jgi:transglutaminase-like putative cysteine protease
MTMSIHYAIQHITRFTYGSTVSESQMEVRMQPRTEAEQTCLEFELSIEPRSRAQSYRDFLGNWVHHFNVPRHHQGLTITARARVEVDPPVALPETLDSAMWTEIDTWAARDDHWDFRHPSRFVAWTDPLVAYADALPAAHTRSMDPLSTVRTVMAAIHRDFEYAPKSTRVDSPIDEALGARKGVCQDFTHIMLAMLRRLGLPCRYVSGYIAPRCAGNTRDLIASATHAWVEVLLPALGWVGFDPTNDAEAGIRHVRVAVGRDYADVPPTRGVFKGDSSSTLGVSVEVKSADLPAAFEPTRVESPDGADTTAPATPVVRNWHWHMQQQQQQ